MENGSFEDVFPIENGDFPASYVSLPEGTSNMLSSEATKIIPKRLSRSHPAFQVPTALIGLSTALSTGIQQEASRPRSGIPEDEDKFTDVMHWLMRRNRAEKD